MRIVSWNVNGIRAAAKKGLTDWFAGYAPDVLCVQETKAHPDQVPPEVARPDGYHVYWSSAKRRGYSGVAAFCRSEPLSVRTLGIGEFDDEGRTLILEYPDFSIISCYFPNSRDGGARLDYKLEYCEAIERECGTIVSAGRNVAVCGDFNISHKPIDLADPKGNEDQAGYLPEERAWLDRFQEAGYVDTFRAFDPSPGRYTWWSYITRARERNVGWRLDYFWVNGGFMPMVRSAGILADVQGSDHCPVTLETESA